MLICRKHNGACVFVCACVRYSEHTHAQEPGEGREVKSGKKRRRSARPRSCGPDCSEYAGCVGAVRQLQPVTCELVAQSVAEQPPVIKIEARRGAGQEDPMPRPAGKNWSKRLSPRRRRGWKKREGKPWKWAPRKLAGTTLVELDPKPGTPISTPTDPRETCPFVHDFAHFSELPELANCPQFVSHSEPFCELVEPSVSCAFQLPAAAPLWHQAPYWKRMEDGSTRWDPDNELTPVRDPNLPQGSDFNAGLKRLFAKKK